KRPADFLETVRLRASAQIQEEGALASKVSRTPCSGVFGISSFSTAGLRPKTRHGDDEPDDERREPHRPPTIGEDPSPSLPKNEHTKHIHRERDRESDQSKSKRGVHAELLSTRG